MLQNYSGNRQNNLQQKKIKYRFAIPTQCRINRQIYKEMSYDKYPHPYRNSQKNNAKQKVFATKQILNYKNVCEQNIEQYISKAQVEKLMQNMMVQLTAILQKIQQEKKDVQNLHQQYRNQLQEISVKNYELINIVNKTQKINQCLCKLLFPKNYQKVLKQSSTSDLSVEQIQIYLKQAVNIQYKAHNKHKSNHSRYFSSASLQSQTNKQLHNIIPHSLKLYAQKQIQANQLNYKRRTVKSKQNQFKDKCLTPDSLKVSRTKSVHNKKI